ncbi:MAG: hypothetical protein MMC33_004290 [Icmadophila ericetorum]|nr:hypothetical protein [Icmadophila ericetorum]
MAKTRPSQKQKHNASSPINKSLLNGTQVPCSNKKHKRPIPQPNPAELLEQATSHLQTGQPNLALPLAEQALATLAPSPSPPSVNALPPLALLGEICLELGDAARATHYFQQAVSLDPEGLVPEKNGGGAEKFLWLAQLCEEGGKESVEWFERGVEVLKRQLGELEEQLDRRRRLGAGAGVLEELEVDIGEKRGKCADALCGIVEVYMTDLSWESTAESVCEKNITHALLLCPSNPTPLQTLASIRLSQSRLAEAKSALSRSLALWKDLPPLDPLVPDFPTRISLARLLMEAEMEDDCIEVLERLVDEDDQSVEAWYLGGWCMFLMAQKASKSDREKEAGGHIEQEVRNLLRGSREWLGNCLQLYENLEYEDERLKGHAVELVEGLDKVVGQDGDDERDEWEDEDEGEEGEGEKDEEDEEEYKNQDEDEKMNGT